MDYEHVFKDHMAELGLSCSVPIIFDGKIHRFKQQNDKGNPCWYWLCFISQNVIFGYFGCWKRDIKGKWCSKKVNNLNTHEKAELRAANTKYIKTLRQVRQNAKQRAQTIWNKSAKL